MWRWADGMNCDETTPEWAETPYRITWISAAEKMELMVQILRRPCNFYKTAAKKSTKKNHFFLRWLDGNILVRDRVPTCGVAKRT